MKNNIQRDMYMAGGEYKSLDLQSVENKVKQLTKDVVILKDLVNQLLKDKPADPFKDL